MADIRNDQFLHRPGVGRGAIMPADPLEVLLYDGSGNPLLVKTPTGEAHAALGVAGYGYDGTSWQPVKVNESGQAEVTLTDRTVVLTTLVDAQAITDTEIRNVTFDASPYRQIDFIIRNSLDSEVAIGFRMADSSWFYFVDDDGAVFSYTPDPEHSSSRWHRVPPRATSGGSRYFMLSQIPLNDGKFKVPFRDYLFTAQIRYRAVNTPTEGSLSIILMGVPN